MKIHKLRGFVLLFVVAIILGGSISTLAQANNRANGFKVSPVLEELTIKKGESETVKMKVTNPADAVVEAKMVANDFLPSSDESGVPRLKLDSDESSGNSFSSLVGELPNITLQPKETATVPVTISVPQDASPGGYYGTVRIEALPGTDSRVNVTASVGTLYLVTVPGDFVTNLEIVELTAAKNESTSRFFIGNGDGLQVVTRLKNNGNIHLKPFGRISITDRSGKTIENYEFNEGEEGGYVLPKSTRKFVDNLNSKGLFGVYKITANLGYGSSGSLMTASNSFVVVPLWLVIVFIALIVLIIVGAVVIYRKLRQTRKHKVSPRRK